MYVCNCFSDLTEAREKSPLKATVVFSLSLSTFPFFLFLPPRNPSQPYRSFPQSKQLWEISTQLRFIDYLIKSLAIYWLSAMRSGIFLWCAPLVFLFYDTLRANCLTIFSDISSDNRETHGERSLGKSVKKTWLLTEVTN